MRPTFLTFLVAWAILQAQNPQTLTLQAPPPPTVSQASATSNVAGPASYFYWIVARWPVGNSPPLGPVTITTAPNTLSASAFVTISWSGNGATSYDVLKTPTASLPGSCTCLLTSATTVGTTVDTGQALSAYTVSGTGAAAGSMAVNNRDYVSARFTFTLPVGLLSGGITFPDGTTQTTAAGGSIVAGTPFATAYYLTATSLGSTGPGTAGQILTSNGAGVAPTYQAPAASGTVGPAVADQVGVFSAASAIGGSTNLTFSSQQLFLNSGTTYPSIDVVSNAIGGPARNADIRITEYNGGSGYSGGFRGRSARGTFAAPTATQAGDNLASFFGQGYGATGFVPINIVGGPGLELIAKQNFTDSAAGTWMGMFTVPNGTISTVEAQRWEHDGSSVFNNNGVASIISQITSLSSVATREAQLLIQNSNAGGWGAALRGRHSAGTVAAPTATQTGNTLLSIYGNGRGASAWGEDLFAGSGGAGIIIAATENYTNAAMGAEMSLCVVGNGTLTVNCPIYMQQNGTTNFFNNLIASESDAVHAWSNSTSDPTATKDTGLARNAAGIVEVNNGTPGTFRDLRLRTPNADTYASSTNCSDGAGAAACGAAPAGSVVIDAAATSVTVSTTAVTANSQILVMEDSSLGTKLGVTCNVTLARNYAVTARTAATSFVITTDVAPVTNPACLSYFIVN